jgi:hypothetical protein
MESDLHSVSGINLILKYVDNTNLLVPENIDVDLKGEYNHIKHWVTINKMCIHERKTKELGFYRPCPCKYHIYDSIDGIEHVNQLSMPTK